METTILLGGALLFYKILQQIFSYTGVTLLSLGTIDSGSLSNSSLYKLMEISKQPCHIVVSILKINYTRSLLETTLIWRQDALGPLLYGRALAYASLLIHVFFRHPMSLHIFCRRVHCRFCLQTMHFCFLSCGIQ